jgi:hypothetical protein
MTKQTKILLGVGAIALAYYLFKDKFALYPKPEQGTSSGGVPIPRGQETPTPYTTDPLINITNPLEPKHQKPSIKNSDDFTFEVLENFSAEFFSSTTGKFTNANFKKGQIIHAKPIPMGNTSGLATTPDGKYPIMGMIGNAIVNVPANKLKRII